MAKKVRIKDIALRAGVSAGTVDRVIHNRGNVSEENLLAVKKVLEEVSYKPSLHLSAISLKKKFKLVVTIPSFKEGEYWESLYNGIERAVEEYESIDISCNYYYYDQFDLFSCRASFEKIRDCDMDAVVIGPTFIEETTKLAHWLDEKGIPYVYVDSMVEGTSPVAYFSADQYKCGFLVSKLITSITRPGSGIALFQAMRTGQASANTTIQRKAGFMGYLSDYGLTNEIHKVPFSAIEPEKNTEVIGDFFERHPNIGGGVVLSSRGSVVADYFRTRGSTDVKLVCIDLTKDNIDAVRSGEIDFLIGQRPEQQGFMAMKAIIKHLVYGTGVTTANYMPLDIITRENIDFYNEFTDLPQL